MRVEDQYAEPLMISLERLQEPRRGSDASRARWVAFALLTAAVVSAAVLSVLSVPSALLWRPVALLIAAITTGVLTGVGLVLAAVGFRKETGWRERWGVWLPAIFGASIVVAFSALVWRWSGARLETKPERLRKGGGGLAEVWRHDWRRAALLSGMEKEWIGLGEAARGLVIDGRIIAIVYAERSGPSPVRGSDEWRETWEFWWIPLDDPNARDVLFGVGEGAGDAWDNRWGLRSCRN